jgi:hypothetical protein
MPIAGGCSGAISIIVSVPNFHFATLLPDSGNQSAYGRLLGIFFFSSFGRDARSV